MDTIKDKITSWYVQCVNCGYVIYRLHGKGTKNPYCTFSGYKVSADVLSVKGKAEVVLCFN